MSNVIRKSRIADKDVIKELIEICFGVRSDLEPYEHLNNRYFLYFKNNILVAMTGLTVSSEYGYPEIDWTCTHPDYRHKGYMQELFSKMLDGITGKVYCSCWRFKNSNYVNLHTIMSLFNFKEVVHSRVHWKVPHNCFRGYKGSCNYYNSDSCECWEDLYLRSET